MPSGSDNPPSSMLFVEKCFASQNAGFLAAPRGISSAKLPVAVACVQMVNPERGAKLQAEFDALPQ